MKKLLESIKTTIIWIVTVLAIIPIGIIMLIMFGMIMIFYLVITIIGLICDRRDY